MREPVPGIVPPDQVPHAIPQGLLEACERALAQAGFSVLVTRSPDGLHCADVPTVIGVIERYVGSPEELAHHRSNAHGHGHVDLLDAELERRLDLISLAKGGTGPLQAEELSGYVANVISNYRRLHAAIHDAATPSGVRAVDISAGWPSTP